jgi:hypothetical protein
MGNKISPQDATSFRQDLNNTVATTNSRIREFNQVFEQQVPEVETFGGGDVDRVSAERTQEALTDAWRNNNVSQDNHVVLGANKAFRLAASVAHIGSADALLDQNAPSTRRCNIFQGFSENQETTFGFLAQTSNPKEGVESNLTGALNQLRYYNNSTSESP